jgi:hypothetical protein
VRLIAARLGAGTEPAVPVIGRLGSRRFVGEA